MENNFSNYQLAFKAKNRAEAEIASGILTSAGIDNKLKQADYTEALSLIRGNATLPFEQWGVYVSAHNLDQSIELVNGASFDLKSPARQKSKALKIAKVFIWTFLTIFFAGLAAGFWAMVNSIATNP